MEFLGVVILILGLIGASLIRSHLRAAKQLRLRQMIHDERIKAMEHNLPLPEADYSELTLPAGKNENNGVLSPVAWMRIVALFVGLTCFFGGIGMTIGFYAAEAGDIAEIWSVGLIPVFIGIGLMIFHRMSAKLVLANGKAEG